MAQGKTKTKNTQIGKFILYGLLACLILAGVFVLILRPWDNSAGTDLTKMNSTMAFAKAQAINSRPSSFAGETIKVKGTHSVSGGQHYITISDPNGCCNSERFQFTYKGTYPGTGKTITVEGTFEKSTSGGKYYINVKSLG